MDSRASTSTIASTPKAKPKQPLIVDTSGCVPMVSKTLTMSPTSSFATFRPSPLNPESIPSPRDKPTGNPKRSSTFPASRPLRPFPSVSLAIATTKPISPSNDPHVREDAGLRTLAEGAGCMVGPKRSPKTIEISSKWKGGFFVLGMTQAEFSRRD